MLLFKSQGLLNIKAVWIVSHSHVCPTVTSSCNAHPYLQCQFIPALSSGISPSPSYVVDLELFQYPGVLPQGTPNASLILDLMLKTHFFVSSLTPITYFL